MLIFTAASIGAVWVRNIWVLLVMRILQSIGISAPWSIGAGTIADLYEVHERGTALGIIFAGMRSVRYVSLQCQNLKLQATHTINFSIRSIRRSYGKYKKL